MTEQIVEGVVSAEVDTEGREVVPNTATVPPRPVNVIWQSSGQVRLIGEQPKTLTERLNEAYDEDAEREDEEFFRNTRAYYERRRNADD